MVHIKPQRFFPKLKMRGNRLVWSDTENEYTETPYVILNITRYKRYPKPNTPLKKLARKVDRLIENGNLKLAQSNLKALGAAINDDRVITENEKNLERSWRDFRQAWIAMLTAKAAQEAAMVVLDHRRRRPGWWGRYHLHALTEQNGRGD